MFIPTPFSLHYKDFELHEAPISLDFPGLINGEQALLPLKQMFGSYFTETKLQNF